MNQAFETRLATLTTVRPAPQPAVVGTTFAGDVTIWSPGAETMFGWSRAEALGRPLDQLVSWTIHADADPEFVFFGGEGIWVREHDIRTRDGATLTVRTTASLVTGPDGEDELVATIAPAGDAAAGVVPDRPFRPIAERGSDLVLICDRELVISFISPSLTKLFGFQARSLIGTSGWRYLAPAAIPALRRQWQLALDLPDSHPTVELKILDSAGTPRQIEVRISNLEDDPSISAMVLNIRDVTEQRALGEALAANERLLDSLLGVAIEGVWIIDPDGRTVTANAQMAAILGVDPARLAAAPVLDFFDPIAQAQIEAHLARRAAGVREQYDLTFLRLDGERRWLRVSAAPRYADGVYLGGIAMITDITAERLLQQQVHRLQGDGHEPAPVRVHRLNDQPGGREPARVPGLNRLSHRESEIVRLLMMGDRPPVIARSLFISQSTVRNHLASAFRKLRVNSQQELIRLLRDGSAD